jgi:ornithine cyclodeaminase/alanine dehydrogenase-like protein (mu-crystallin family)
MPGRIHGDPFAIVKLVTVVPGNVSRKLPTILGTAILFDSRTGEPVASLDGAALTAVRTGAISAAAVRALVDPGAKSMALLGAGGQSAWQARAISSVVHVENIAVWSPSSENRDRIAALLHRDLHAEVTSVDNVQRATCDADIICCATTASTAFVEADMLRRPNPLVVAIGAFSPEMAEVGVTVFRKAGRVYADDVGAVLHEAGDVLHAIRENAIRRRDVHPVGELMADATTPPEGVRIFKSVGSAVEDAAVAAAILQLHSS